MLKLDKLDITFNSGTINEKHALDNVSLVLEDGDFVSVIGSNGAGKSTLLNAIAGSYEVDSGQILLDDKDITFMKEYARANYIGRLFQDPLKGSAPNMTIEENLGLAFARGKHSKMLSKGIKTKDREIFIKMLKKLGLGLETRLNSNVGLLSGGQRQALTLLMSTIVTPRLLLLDEHTAALDPKTAKQVMSITEEIVETNNITTIMITHNIQNALDYGNKTIVMNQGKIVLVLEGEERKNMSVEKLMKLYSDKASASFSDNMLL
ncbi:MAG: ATP-binding cassette domain-containing protein [Erysipelotrichaceae bacterium]